MIDTFCRILEQELQWERELFFALNGSNFTFWDYFFWLCSNPYLEACIYIGCFFIFTYTKDYKEIILIVLSVILVFFLCDRVASGFFKPVFHRLRPTHHPDFKEQVNIVFGYRGGLYGFISGHAANAFGFATLMALISRNRVYGGMILLFACLIGYSRIYLGVHFISDVIGGALIGVLLGYVTYKLYNFCRRYFLKNKKG